MSTPAHRLALVTGASAGIGAAFARLLAREGFDVALVARRRHRLEALARELEQRHGRAALVFAEDLSDPDAPDRLARGLSEAGRSVDVLVNNAGFGMTGTFVGRTWEEHRRFLELMVVSYAHLTHLFLPGMLERRWGRIVQVASTAALTPQAAGHTLYGASKAFLVKMSEALAAECEGTGVHVTALCPGFTETEFHDVTGTRDQVRRLPSFLWMSAERVAREGWRAVEAGVPVHVPGLANRTIWRLSRWLPQGLARALVKRQGRRFRDLEGN